MRSNEILVNLVKIPLEGRKYLIAVHATEDSWRNYPKAFQKIICQENNPNKWDVEQKGKQNCK